MVLGLSSLEIFDYRFNLLPSHWSIWTSIYSWFSLGKCMFLQYLHFSKLSSCWHTIFHSNLYVPFNFCGFHCNVFLSFIILLSWILSLFYFITVAKGLSILFNFLQKQLSVCLIFSIVFQFSVHLFLF